MYTRHKTKRRTHFDFFHETVKIFMKRKGKILKRPFQKQIGYVNC